MLDVVMLPSGWASFWWRWVMRMPANASEENENDFRLCRLTAEDIACKSWRL
jgi:hypothetical protein